MATESLNRRLAEKLRSYDPDATELLEVPCRQCGGIGQALISAGGACCEAPKGFAGLHMHRCFYCNGTGSMVQDRAI